MESNRHYAFKVFIFFFIILCEPRTSIEETNILGLYESNRLLLPRKFKQMSIHGHTGLYNEDRSSLYIPSKVISPECQTHSVVYSNALDVYEIWAVQMLDSSGKVPSSLLNGHYQDLGNYDECMETATESPIPIQYCVLRIKNLVDVPKTPVDWDSDKRKFTAGGIPFLKPYMNIGLCLPASCSLIDLSMHYAEVTSKYNMSVELDKHSCTASDEKVTLLLKDIFIIVLMVFLKFMAIASFIFETFYSKRDTNLQGSMVQKILECFSWRRNGEYLFGYENPEKPLAAIHGLKALSAVWIIFSHHIYLVHSFPLLNYMKFLKLSLGWGMDLAIHGELAVDTFFLINGLLTSYFTARRFDNKRRFSVLQFYIHRFIRIAPLYFICIGTVATVGRFYGDGPLWKHYTGTTTENCIENWWTHMLFVNNFINIDKQCISATWYLAIDMQLAILSPLLLIPIVKRKKIVPYFLVPLLILAVNAVSIYVNYSNNYPGTHLYDRFAFREDMYANEYTQTYTRCSPWLLGIIVGFMLGTESIKLSKLKAIAGWMLSGIPVILVLLVSRHLHSRGVRHDLLLSSLHNGLHSTLWSMFVAWIIIACETGYGGPVKRLLTLSILQPISRMALTIFLAGGSLQYIIMASRGNSNYYAPVLMLRDYCGELVMILIICYVLWQLYEAPFIRLGDVFTKKSESTKSTEVAEEHKHWERKK